MAEAVVLFRTRIVRFNVESDENDDDTNRRQFIPIPGTHVFVKELDDDLFDDTAATTPASDSVPGLANELQPRSCN